MHTSHIQQNHVLCATFGGRRLGRSCTAAPTARAAATALAAAPAGVTPAAAAPAAATAAFDVAQALAAAQCRCTGADASTGRRTSLGASRPASACLVRATDVANDHAAPERRQYLRVRAQRAAW